MTRAGFAASAVAAVARSGLRRRWPALVAIGFAAGLVGGLVTGSFVAARRTATAFDRLTSASAADDVRAFVFSDDTTLAERVRGLPPVAQAWTGKMAVARVEGRGVTYAGVFVGPVRPPGLLEPIVVAGRPADPAVPDEVVVIERWAELSGVSPGDTLDLSFLTSREFAAFDVGFGDPDGPRVRVRVTGTVRLTGTTNTPIFTTPAFAANAAGTADIRAGDLLLLRVRDGRRGISAVRAGITELSGGSGTAPDAGEFLPVQVIVPSDEAREVDASARVLVVGLAVLGVAAALAGGLALTQALARHHDAQAGDQRVEEAIGLTPGERAAARALAALLASAIAGVVTAALAVAAGRVEPLGGVAAYEPHPGFHAHVAATAVGGLAAATTVTVLAALTAWRAGRRPVPAGAGAARAMSLARAGVRAAPVPAIANGIALALPHPGPRGRAVPVRTTLAGAVVGVAGLVAATTFAASLERLGGSPERWGWDADAAVVDATDEIVAALASDGRLAGISVLERAPVLLGGSEVDTHALSPVRGRIGWTILDGRPPAGPGEITLGLHVARRLRVDVGDPLPTGRGQLRVVGTGVGPTFPPRGIGEMALLTPDGLAAAAETQTLREALVSVTPEADRAAVLDELGAAYEVNPRVTPPDVANLDDLGSLPMLLGGFLAVVGVAALVHALATAVRRRRRDLAVLQTLGFTPREVARAVAVLALVTVAAGLLAGVPLGLGIGRLVWWAVADATGVASDARISWPALLTVILGGPLAALAAGLIPARAAARLRPSAVLHAE